MKKIMLMLLLTTSITSVFGQEEKSNYKKITDKFEQFYNEGKTDSIFGLFADVMQKALPLAKTTAFLKELNAQAGTITSREFVKYNDSYAIYKTKFERALFSLNISLDAQSKINGLFIKPYTEYATAAPERNKTALSLPFKGEWTVMWGGDTKALNYHVEHKAQKNAFDLLIQGQQGKSYQTDGKKNEDYYAFGKELIAPCDGEIVLAVDGVKDNTPGILNPIYIPGNTVILKTAHQEYLLFAHFKQYSIKVKEGQKVKKGQLLGLCGNSGNSSEPHLHFHIQNTEDMNVATGIKCYFDKLFVNGVLKTDYSPVQKDKVRPNKP